MSNLLTDETIQRIADADVARLRPETAALRDAAFTTEGWYVYLPTYALIDARSWSEHTPEEPWLIWRARWGANRLRAIPLEIVPGERIVGRPSFRELTPEERAELEAIPAPPSPRPGSPGGDEGHFHPDYEKILRLGVRGILEEVAALRAATDDPEKQAFYDACRIAMEGLSDLISRVAEACRELGEDDLAALCDRIATEPPTTFHEAIELIWLVLVALWFAEDHGMSCPGRLDQTLRPFYEADLAAGHITRDDALDLICQLYIQLNEIFCPGGAIAVIVGGRDAEGRDVTNELTYLCIEARALTRLCYPTVGIAWHSGTPPELMEFGCRMAAKGFGDPAFFNDEVISAGLRDHGVSLADSYNWMNSTCVEIKPVGTGEIWVASPYFNCCGALLDVIDQIAEGAVPKPNDLQALIALVRDNLADEVRRTAVQNDATWHRREELGGYPLASCLIHDCLERGRDFDRGGPRYHWVECSFVGVANLVDSLVAIKRLVFESGELSLSQFREILQADFEGHDEVRSRILHQLPSYGNDDDEADDLAVQWTGIVQDIAESNTIGGHRYVPGFFCWIMHGEMGKNTDATPDGRKAGVAFADGAGAAQGRELSGPTASVLSTTKWSHQRALGGLVQNVKFTRGVLGNEAGLAALRSLIETYLARGGFEIQVNVLDSDTLRAAQEHPEEHEDLLVRVAGYSDYFTHLPRHMQDEVIARTEHAL